MKVTLVAQTQLAWPDNHNTPLDKLFKSIGWRPKFWGTKSEKDKHPDALAEFAGRACYQSWSRPNPKTATNEGYMKHILEVGHESVLEHASATFYVEGVSRALTHELIRHRHLSYSELSQRFVNVEDADIVPPPAIDESWDDRIVWNSFGEYTKVGKEFTEANRAARRTYATLVSFLTEKGLPRKQAREAARAVLPNATETKIVVTGNMRAWRDMLKKRYHVAADAEIREFAGEILRQLREIAPNTFQDIPEEPFSYE